MSLTSFRAQQIYATTQSPQNWVDLNPINSYQARRDNDVLD